jgi:two-component system phosphate regulon sensor histidine kinase PhoR
VLDTGLRNNMLKKLSHKLIASYISIISVLVIIIFLLVGTLLKQSLVDILIDEMAGFAEIIELSALEKGIINNPAAVKSGLTKMALPMSMRISIIEKDGTVIADTGVEDESLLDNHLYRVEVMQALETGTGQSRRYSNSIKTDMLYYAKNSGSYIIRLARPLYAVDESMRQLRDLLITVSLLVMVIAVISVITISFKITRPLNETLSFASSFAGGSYNRRIRDYSSDEIGTLQKTLNKMADTIVETIDKHIFEQRKLEVTLDSISDGISLIAPDKEIIISNRSFIDMLKITSSFNGKEYYEVIRNRTLNSRIEKALKSGTKEIFELEVSEDKFFDVVINPIKGEHAIQGTLVLLRDVSEKKKIERIKSDLVSNVSHELKTPIAIVKGYLETIRENPLDRKMTEEFINRAIENVDRQNSLIEDIIKLSMIESSTEFQKEEIDIRQIIERCFDILSPKVASKGLTLKMDFDRSSYPISGNSFIAEEIFFNLIDNAINYNNPSGSITIRGEKKGSTSTFSISDTGIGIPERAIDRIFERFYRVDAGRSRVTGGTGLGLSIVKHAIQVMGWSVSVKSDKNGTTFTVIAGK